MPGKQKIAILGGGPAGLTAAFGLTSTQELRDRYDITIYQVGWRAGGKCSSGREGPTNRIEQNGTHYLFGCYDNGFRMLRTVYEELRLAGVTDFGTYEEAFLPRDLLVLKQFFRGNWKTWPIQLPTNRVEPGTHPGLLSGADYVSMVVQFVFALILPRRLFLALRP
ncbi:MAG: NAD(P)-binding protein, partial [Gemmatimonadota bacterium]|nr:NAD(P)-binding protein [Gemmatimonadota bacterium]